MGKKKRAAGPTFLKVSVLESGRVAFRPNFCQARRPVAAIQRGEFPGKNANRRGSNAGPRAPVFRPGLPGTAGPRAKDPGNPWPQVSPLDMEERLPRCYRRNLRPVN